MDEQTTTGSGSSLASAVSWPVWLLLAGAVVQLGVQIAPDSYRVFGPYLLVEVGMVVDWVRSISLFLLPAAVVLAADRWPSGRRKLLIGAAALAIFALLGMGLDIWWAVWEASGHVYDGSQPWVLGGYVAGAVLFVIAHVLLAAGLWRARAHRPIGRTRAVLVAVIGLGGLVATGVGLWVVARILALGPGDHLPYSVGMMTLTAAGFAALALLALAAARVAPHPGGLPEILIAAGAVITMAATTWAWTFPYFTPGLQQVSEEAFVWVFTLPNVAVAVGMVAMIAGFGLGAVAVHRVRTADGLAA